MFEMVETWVQIVILIFCLGFALTCAIMKKNELWVLLTFFYGSYLLGDLYWAFNILFFGKTPDISLISDFSWYTMYLFLFLMFRYAFAKHGYLKVVSKKPIFFVIPVVGPVFTALMAAFYMQYGSYFSNVVYALLMGMLLYALIYVFLNFKVIKSKSFRALCYLTLLLCVAEYGAWTMSCFFTEPTISNPFYIFDMLLTLIFPAYIPIISKEVES